MVICSGFWFALADDILIAFGVAAIMVYFTHIWLLFLCT